MADSIIRDPIKRLALYITLLVKGKSRILWRQYNKVNKTLTIWKSIKKNTEMSDNIYWRSLHDYLHVIVVDDEISTVIFNLSTAVVDGRRFVWRYEYGFRRFARNSETKVALKSGPEKYSSNVATLDGTQVEKHGSKSVVLNLFWFVGPLLI